MCMHNMLHVCMCVCVCVCCVVCICADKVVDVELQVHTEGSNSLGIVYCTLTKKWTLRYICVGFPYHIVINESKRYEEKY